MSTLQVQSNVVSNGTTVTNTISTGTLENRTSINATHITISNTVFMNRSMISVGGSGGNNILQQTISEPSITVNGNIITTLTVNTEICNVQIFTSNGTYTKPSWAAALGAANTSADLILVHLWGAGGGGNTTSPNSGGGGGAFVYGIYLSTTVNATAGVTVGIGGVAGAAGGNSVFGNSLSFDSINRSLTAYGGGSGNSTFGGGGGGWLSQGVVRDGGDPLGANSSVLQSTFGGGRGGSGQAATSSIYGGGGGSLGANNPGDSIFGGGGGAGATNTVGTSVYGGFGANSSTAPSIPGGGGAGTTNTTGANGKVIVFTIRKTS